MFPQGAVTCSFVFKLHFNALSARYQLEAINFYAQESTAVMTETL
jgi:hypothetical protein